MAQQAILGRQREIALDQVDVETCQGSGFDGLVRWARRMQFGKAMLFLVRCIFQAIAEVTGHEEKPW